MDRASLAHKQYHLPYSRATFLVIIAITCPFVVVGKNARRGGVTNRNDGEDGTDGESKSDHDWRTRQDPFETVWPEVEEPSRLNVFPAASISQSHSSPATNSFLSSRSFLPFATFFGFEVILLLYLISPLSLSPFRALRMRISHSSLPVSTISPPLPSVLSARYPSCRTLLP